MRIEMLINCLGLKGSRIRLYIWRNNQSISINPILIRVCPHKWGWPDLAHPNSNLSNSHSPSRSIQGILLLQTNTLALLLHLQLTNIGKFSNILEIQKRNVSTVLQKSCEKKQGN